MKIELINENQIKCTLNRADLAGHHIKLSELAYGTEKTKDLFQDMMDQAFNEFGFEATDALMIEAIPISMDCIVLMITKVDEPEDLDQGFSNIANLTDMILKSNEREEESLDELDELIDSLSDDHFIENGVLENPTPSPKVPNEPETTTTVKPASRPLERIFSFDDIETVIEFAHKANPGYKGKSSLYKSPESGKYFLVLVNTTRAMNKFGQICSLALEYASKENSSIAKSAFFYEHYETIIKENALGQLAEI